MRASTTFASLLQRYFTQRLIQQREASPHTISSYRDVSGATGTGCQHSADLR